MNVEIHRLKGIRMAESEKSMIEITCNDRLGKKVRVKCRPDDTIGISAPHFPHLVHFTIILFSAPFHLHEFKVSIFSLENYSILMP